MATQSPPGSAFAAADPGFTAVPVEELLASVEELVARIRMCFGIDRDTFELDVQPLLRNYAAYVHLLPATADNYFSAPGGLLRLGSRSQSSACTAPTRTSFRSLHDFGAPTAGTSLAPGHLHRRAVQ